MSDRNPNPVRRYSFRPLKTAKVSEISEATSASPVAREDKVNFHIGHPVQDDRLRKLYMEMILGRPVPQDHDRLIPEGDHHRRLDDPAIRRIIENAVEQSGPYMPRGGFSPGGPDPLALLFKRWMTEHQAEPLTYSLGEPPGHKEMVYSMGGLSETLRVVLHSLSQYQENSPTRMHFWRINPPHHLAGIPGLDQRSLSHDEGPALAEFEKCLAEESTGADILVLGAVPQEETRRRLRRFTVEHGQIILECNDAPNHLSLAREAGLSEMVLRLLTPAAIDPSLSLHPLVFVCGNADFIKIIETVHFELKGTPAAAEVLWLTSLMERHLDPLVKMDRPVSNLPDPGDDLESSNIFSECGNHAGQVGDLMGRMGGLVETHSRKAAAALDTFSRIGRDVSTTFMSLLSGENQALDPLAGLTAEELTGQFLDGTIPANWIHNLIPAFLSAFLQHHPEYSAEHIQAVSGSARTALSLLGFHCGIEEVLTPDLSWTYEHCFPKVTAVPLNADLSIDVESLIKTVDDRLALDPGWRHRGAVILNNPHNASGRVFDEAAITRILLALLEREVRVIDDLSYQGVAPENRLSGPESLRRLANLLVERGKLKASRARYLITMHSLSKTDGFAGARLSVLEIRHSPLRDHFAAINRTISPNYLALLLAYLFYRNQPAAVRAYWRMRNRILAERMNALEQAHRDLPPERNPYGIRIRPPQGAMYPHLVIDRLPPGISLDWLSSGLAKRGIGLIPLTAFARLKVGYELARKAFRLSLGGTDGSRELTRKMRRVLIDLNRIIAEEASNYTRRTVPEEKRPAGIHSRLSASGRNWREARKQLIRLALKNLRFQCRSLCAAEDIPKILNRFRDQYLPHRLDEADRRFQERLYSAARLMEGAAGREKNRMMERLERELYKESISSRTRRFRHRLYDRTVHPTQMYSLQLECRLDTAINEILSGEDIHPAGLERAGRAMAGEFLGINVPIPSNREGMELVADLRAVASAENWAFSHDVNMPSTLHSFWGDWDGSTRPSGQGHRLVAEVLIENVLSLSRMLDALTRTVGPLDLDAALRKDINNLESASRSFRSVLNSITTLTNQLEKRCCRMLPSDALPGKLRSAAIRLGLSRDPIEVMWQHNDRVEKKMLKLRARRRAGIERFFSLNKRLRKALFAHLHLIEEHIHQPELALAAGGYRSLLKRFALTPRIHQKIIQSSDQFAIDTTVHNIMEINALAGKYGNPGLVMALQVSFSTDPEAFIALERKLGAEKERILRGEAEIDLPGVSVVPLFEDMETVGRIDAFLDRIWKYAIKSRRMEQTKSERFCEMLCELFIAGSDLSQQVGQLKAARLYNEARHTAVRWLSERGLATRIRIKLGSGEPMQRQGGYYDPLAGRPTAHASPEATLRAGRLLKPATARSLHFASSPLRGVLAGGDFRTFQSLIAEQLRHISDRERVEILLHIRNAQQHYENNLERAAEPLIETRLRFREKGLKELEHLTGGAEDPVYESFLDLTSRYFRQILFGGEKDVMGIHVISYFISRMIPPLRDRPVVRPGQDKSQKSGRQVVERLTKVLPLSRHGSLLRAIGHNRAQSHILGVSQLSTGVFRSLSEFAHDGVPVDRKILISDRILPRLPVHDILHNLRLLHDPELCHVRALEQDFPAGNSAFLALREDNDSIKGFTGLLQKELLRRQGLDVSEFFYGDRIISGLLPSLRPDLAVLLQPDIHNTDLERLLSPAGRKVDREWSRRMEDLLRLPLEIRSRREEIWRLIGKPIHQQVQSFIGLAAAVTQITDGNGASAASAVGEPHRIARQGLRVVELLRGREYDSMHNFLIKAVSDLARIPGNREPIPIEAVRALSDIERIVRIERQALDKMEQARLRFLSLQIARLVGENG